VTGEGRPGPARRRRARLRWPGRACSATIRGLVRSRTTGVLKQPAPGKEESR
jgi:hypothetical protein